VGSLEVGKLADIVIFDKRSPGFLPSINPIKNLVYSTGNNRPIRTVLIDGKIVYHDREFPSIDEASIYTRVEEKCRELFAQLDRLDEYNMYNTSPWQIS
jgi:cytosine/adenosine deaminase-related metal-dependent hydrolase